MAKSQNLELDSANVPCLVDLSLVGLERIFLFAKAKRIKKFYKDFYLIFRTRFCDSQNLDLDCHADSANLLAMTKYCKCAFDSQSIRATNRNRSNGGGGFVFMKNFGIKLD